MTSADGAIVQEIRAVSGFADGVIGYDLHVFSDSSRQREAQVRPQYGSRAAGRLGFRSPGRQERPSTRRLSSEGRQVKLAFHMSYGGPRAQPPPWPGLHSLAAPDQLA